MLTNDFQGIQLPRLGFGAMRLPCLPDGTIDEALTADMVRYAMDHGVNYFDTAYAYLGGESERVMGRVLKAYPRESFFLATKYPGHQIFSDGHNPARVFEDQLKKCGVEYFDFYLLHNVFEKSMEVYLDPDLKVIEYFKEQKRLGRIRHLGFSTHAEPNVLKQFLDICGDDMEFCQIQLNYLDWSLQNAKFKYEMLTERGIPVWVMEPVRGGGLASLQADWETKLKALRPDDSIASWGFRFLQELPNVKMILSGMSNMDHVVDNVKTFTEYTPLSEEERNLLLDIAESMKDSVPCTACRYCCAGCPMGLDIPGLISAYNELRIGPAFNTAMRIEFMPDDKKPSACVDCGQCTQMCPQNIDVPAAMRHLTELLKDCPSWAEICKQREAQAKNAE